MNRFLECSCGEIMIKSYNNTIKIRNKVLVFKDNQAFAVCKGCGVEHPIPIQLMKSVDSKAQQNPKLYLRKK